jgi:hypothetical protein
MASAEKIQSIVAENETSSVKRLRALQAEIATAASTGVIIHSTVLEGLLIAQAHAQLWTASARAFKRTDDFQGTLLQQLEDLHDTLTSGGSGRSTSKVANAYHDAADAAARSVYRTLRHLR